jgi:Cu(I)/Ag(I) efflux system membrane protein CusA/SilA
LVSLRARIGQGRGRSRPSAVSSQYQVDLDPNKLLAYNIPLSEASRRSNITPMSAARYLRLPPRSISWRGRGYIKDPRDIENIVLKVENGTPVYIRNVGTVHLGLTSGRGCRT